MRHERPQEPHRPRRLPAPDLCRRPRGEQVLHNALRPRVRRHGRCCDILARHGLLDHLPRGHVDGGLGQGGVCGEVVEEVGRDAAGAEIDDLDLEGGQLDPQVVGQHRRGGLGRVVDALHRHGRDRGYGRVVDDHGAVVGVEEQGQKGLRDGQQGPDVQVEALARFGDVRVRQRHVVAGAGVVDEDVETAAALEQEGGDGGDACCD